MTKKVFKIKLKKPPGGTDSTYFIAPFNVLKEFGTKARVKVRGTINGYRYRSSITPMRRGEHWMVVNREIRQATGVKAGDTVTVIMKQDNEPRYIILPKDFEKALNKNKKIRKVFDKFSYSHKKEYIQWIIDAKKSDIRIRRINKTIKAIFEKIK